MNYREEIQRLLDGTRAEEVTPPVTDDELLPLASSEEVIPLSTKDYVIISDVPDKPATDSGVSCAPVVKIRETSLSEIEKTAPSVIEESSPSESPDPYLDRMILGRYETQSLIGLGGMGRVYKAYQHTVDRFVAVKILPCGPAGINEQVAKRFHLEARAASRLSHPNTITVHDFGQIEDGSLCIVMEYLTGQTLEYVIAERPSLARILRIALQICGSLAEAHKSGIIHRDLKPPNIIVSAIGDDKDWVKVLDFGIVKLLDTSNSVSLSVDGMVSGTPEYMSPEQVRDDPLDARSDIYSLGLLLYELFTGKAVVSCKTPLACMYAHIHNTPSPFSRVRPDHGVPEGLEATVMKMLAKNANDRFQSIAELMPIFTEYLLSDVTQHQSQPPMGNGSFSSMLPPKSILSSTPPRTSSIRPSASSSAPPSKPNSRIPSTSVKPSPNQILASELEQTLREGNVQKALSMVRTTLGEDPSNETAIEYAGHIYEVAGDGVLDQDEVIWLKALLGKAGDKSSRKPSLGVEETSPTTSALVSISGGAFESTFGGTYIMPSFEMQKCPVTNAEYKAFIKETGELPPAHWLGNEPPADALDAPVVGVSIGDARRYAAWCGMRLPTTAEWEAAVRLPDGRQFPWGNEWKSEYCHCKENGASEPGPVGQYPLGASHFGCLDLLGNVWEWTEHHEGMKPPETGYYWVMGGSFRHPCEKNGKIARTDVSENGAYPYLGFRCVRELQRKRK